MRIKVTALQGCNNMAIIFLSDLDVLPHFLRKGSVCLIPLYAIFCLAIAFVLISLLLLSFGQKKEVYRGTIERKFGIRAHHLMRMFHNQKGLLLSLIHI